MSKENMNNKFENTTEILKSMYNTDFVDKLLNLTETKVDVYIFGGMLRDIFYGDTCKEADMRAVVPLSFDDRQKLVENVLQELGILIDEKVIIKEIDLIVYRFLPLGSKTDYAIDLSVVPDLKTNVSDFTVNSLYFDLRTSQILDRFGGIPDLENKILRTCIEPNESFKTKPADIFRAVKSICKNNLTISPDTKEALINNVNETKNVLNTIGANQSRLLVELYLSDIFRGLKYSPYLYFNLHLEFKIFETLIKFFSKNKDIFIPTSVDNPFKEKEKYTFEKAISMYVTTLSGCIGDKEENFNTIRSFLTLNVSPTYKDFVIDPSQIVLTD